MNYFDFEYRGKPGQPERLFAISASTDAEWRAAQRELHRIEIVSSNGIVFALNIATANPFTEPKEQAFADEFQQWAGQMNSIMSSFRVTTVLPTLSPSFIPPPAAMLTPSPLPPPREEITLWIYDDDQQRTYTCIGGDRIAIVGNNKTLTFYGHCASVTVSKDNNIVRFEAIDNILVVGNGNTVTWSQGHPQVMNRGNNNQIQASP